MFMKVLFMLFTGGLNISSCRSLLLGLLLNKKLINTRFIFLVNGTGGVLIHTLGNDSCLGN